MRTVILFILVILVSSCGKFEAAKPDPNQIMTLHNASFSAFTTANIDGVPTPFPPPPSLPSLPPAKNEKLDAPTTPNLNDYPYSSMGRLSYVKQSMPYICSGQLVGDGTVLLTAAHCVFDRQVNTWTSDFAFFLGYDYGSYRRAFDWECVAMYSGWHQGQYNKDYAFIKLRGPASEHRVGIRPNSKPARFESVGYPSTHLNAQRLHSVFGTRGHESRGVVEMKGNPFGPGSSGGAWIVDDSTDVSLAIGLNSFGIDNRPNSMFGPQFDGRTVDLYNFVENNCQQDIFPLGKNPKTNKIISSIDKDTTYVGVDTDKVSYGPKLIKKSSNRCTCDGAKEWLLKNDASDTDYEVEVEVTALADDDPQPLSSSRFGFKSEKTQDLTLGCTKGNLEGEQCRVELHYSITSMRRFVDDKRIGFRGAVTPNFCEAQCLTNLGGGYCRRLGNAAKPIMAQLGGFLTETVDGSADANGVTTRKRDLIVRLGGDANTEDPCNRSDFFKSSDTTSNDGLACITVTPSISTMPDEARLGLRVPPVATSKQVLTANGGKTSAQFATRIQSPIIEFFTDDGTSANDLNKLYGGRLQFVQRQKNQLIATTENGCLLGDEK